MDARYGLEYHDPSDDQLANVWFIPCNLALKQRHNSLDIDGLVLDNDVTKQPINEDSSIFHVCIRVIEASFLF